MLQRTNPMTKVLLSVVLFEMVCSGLAIPVMINVDHVPGMTAGLAGGGVCLLALAASATLRIPVVGYPLGWLTQLGVLALGFLSPGMWFIGGLFGMLWVISFILGKRLERLTAEHAAAG